MNFKQNSKTTSKKPKRTTKEKISILECMSLIILRISHVKVKTKTTLVKPHITNLALKPFLVD